MEQLDSTEIKARFETHERRIANLRDIIDGIPMDIELGDRVISLKIARSALDNDDHVRAIAEMIDKRFAKIEDRLSRLESFIGSP